MNKDAIFYKSVFFFKGRNKDVTYEGGEGFS